MRLVAPSFTLAMLLLAAMAGCQSLGEPGDLTPKSLLQAAASSPDAVTLDIYWARTERNLGEQEEGIPTVDQLWNSVQEDRIPLEVRRALAENGLRAGVVGGTPSPQIARLLNPTGADPDTTGERPTLSRAKITRRLLQLRPGRRAELQVSDEPRTMRLLRRIDGQLTGRSYPDARGIYGLEVVSTQNDQIELQLTPELHHGQMRMQYTPSGPGRVVQRLAREVEVFTDLQVRVTLTPGEILLVTSLSKSSHCVGGLFYHTESDSVPQQKVLLIRVSQVPESHAIAAQDASSWPWR